MIFLVESFLGPKKKGTSEEGWRIQRLKHCEKNNKDEDNSPKTLTDKNHQASSQKFRQLNFVLFVIALLQNSQKYFFWGYSKRRQIKQKAPRLNSGETSNLWWLRKSNHRKITEKSLMCTEKYVVIKEILTMGEIWVCHYEQEFKRQCMLWNMKRPTTIGFLGGARGVVVIVVGNGHGDTSSNPGRDWLHFT